MKKSFLITALALFISLQLSAQAPGYMGKRFAVKYNVNIFPTRGHTISNYEVQKTSTMGVVNGLNVTHEGVLEYAAFRKSTIGLMVSNYKTGYKYYDDHFTQNRYRIGKISQTAYGAFFRTYTGGSLAFVGNYFQLDGSLTNSKIYLYSSPLTPISVNGFIAGMSIGTQKILFNRFIYEIGIRSSWAVSAGMGEYRDEVIEARRRVRNAHVISVKLGLGTLLF